MTPPPPPFGFVSSTAAKNECETMKEHAEMNLSLESRLLEKEK